MISGLVYIAISTPQCVEAFDRKIYSGFAKHMGRYIYGGIVPSAYSKLVAIPVRRFCSQLRLP